jgi:hypothetical protein
LSLWVDGAVRVAVLEQNEGDLRAGYVVAPARLAPDARMDAINTPSFVSPGEFQDQVLRLGCRRSCRIGSQLGESRGCNPVRPRYLRVAEVNHEHLAFHRHLSMTLRSLDAAGP